MTDLPTTSDVVVVGAGLAGLCAAIHLSQAGRDVLLLERDDDVGGRVRTDEVDGITIDRGFQLYNPAYPEGRRMLDHDALDLKPFTPGVMVAADDRRHRLADPRRVPSWAWDSLRAPVATPAEKARLAAYATKVTRARPHTLTTQVDGTAAMALARAGLHGRVTDMVLRPFLSGVFLEPDLTTSRRFMDLVVRSFVRATPAVPAAGMQAIPRQLASRLPTGTIRTGITVDSVTNGRVTTSHGLVTTTEVVVATDPTTASKLLRSIAPPQMHGVTTWYHLADVAPETLTDGDPVLVVDGQRRGPLVNTVVLTHAATSYAPGRVLVSSSALGRHDDSESEQAARRHLALLHGVSTERWELVATTVVDEALPAMPPPHDFRRAVDLGGGLYVAGDHRDSSSIQGAMVSGRRAADAVLSRTRG